MPSEIEIDANPMTVEYVVLKDRTELVLPQLPVAVMLLEDDERAREIAKRWNAFPELIRAVMGLMGQVDKPDHDPWTCKQGSCTQARKALVAAGVLDADPG